jgi:hypothetical protein
MTERATASRASKDFQKLPLTHAGERLSHARGRETVFAEKRVNWCSEFWCKFATIEPQERPNFVESEFDKK